MNGTIAQETFTQQFFEILDEAFVTHHGFFLDRGNSLFETLAEISAAEASVPVGGKCASLAAQVTHVIFYLDVTEQYMVGQPPQNVDWGEIWRTVEKISPDEWNALREKLTTTYQRVNALMRAQTNWDNADFLGGALAIVVHTAYHLGEIRQALCTLR